MVAVLRDIIMEQGATWRLSFTYYDDLLDPDGNVMNDVDGNPLRGSPRDWSGWLGRMQVRERYDTAALISLTSDDIILGVDGTVRIVAGALMTDGLLQTVGGHVGQPITQGVYDLEVYRDDDPENVDQLLRGKVTVWPNATRVDP
jgi:hypothetical protein